MNPSQRRERFRAILAGPVVHPASVHDAISARIAEDLGLNSACSAARWCARGAGHPIRAVDPTEFADQPDQVPAGCRCLSMPTTVRQCPERDPIVQELEVLASPA
jgi:hypothetical protein